MQGITQPTPKHARGQKMLTPTRQKRGSLFLEKSHRKQFRKPRSENRVSVSFRFSVRFCIRSDWRASIDAQKENPPRRAGRSVIVPTIGGRSGFGFSTIAHGRQYWRVVLVVLLSGRNRSGLDNTRIHNGARFPHLCDL